MDGDALPGLALYLAAHQSLSALRSGVEADHFPLVLGAEGAGDGQEVDGLQKGGLSLGVGPEEHDHSRGQFQFQVLEAPEVGQAEARDAGQRLDPLPDEWGTASLYQQEKVSDGARKGNVKGSGSAQ